MTKEEFIPSFDLITARNYAHMTQEEVCKILQIGRPTLREWENGIKEPRITQFRQLCEIYQIPFDYIHFELKTTDNVSVPKKSKVI